MIDNYLFRKVIFLPCGGTAYFDDGAGFGYRCKRCGAVVGSVGMPRYCQEEDEKLKAWQKLGGKGWDYNTGKEKEDK